MSTPGTTSLLKSQQFMTETSKTDRALIYQKLNSEERHTSQLVKAQLKELEPYQQQNNNSLSEKLINSFTSITSNLVKTSKRNLVFLISLLGASILPTANALSTKTMIEATADNKYLSTGALIAGTLVCAHFFLLPFWKKFSLPVWVIGDREYRLAKKGNNLNYLLVNKTTGEILKEESIDLGNDTIDEKIAYLRKCRLRLEDDGNVRFIRGPVFADNDESQELPEPSKTIGDTELRLVMNGNILKFLVINKTTGEKSFLERTLDLGGLTVDQKIDYLRKCQAFFNTNDDSQEIRPSIKYQEIPEPRWTVGDREIRLVRNGNILKFLVINKTTGKKLFLGPPIDIGGLTVDQKIEYLRRCRPVLNNDSTVQFSKYYKTQSQIDNEIMIDNDDWAITMGDCGSSDWKESLSWGGHAALFIEGVKDGYYFIKRVHLVSKSLRKGIVEEHELKTFIWKKDHDLSETWARSAVLVQRMLDKIQEITSKQKEGKTAVYYGLSGSDAIFSLSSIRVNGHRIKLENCFTWEREMLSLANIVLWNNKKVFFVSTPKGNLKPLSLLSKAKVIVVVTPKPKTYGFLKSYVNDIDITKYLHEHEKTRNRSWQILPFITDRIIFDGVKVRFNGPSCSLINGKFHVKECLLPVKIRGERTICYIDVSEHLTKYISIHTARFYKLLRFIGYRDEDIEKSKVKDFAEKSVIFC